MDSITARWRADKRRSNQGNILWTVHALLSSQKRGDGTYQVKLILH